MNLTTIQLSLDSEPLVKITLSFKLYKVYQILNLLEVSFLSHITSSVVCVIMANET